MSVKVANSQGARIIEKSPSVRRNCSLPPTKKRIGLMDFATHTMDLCRLSSCFLRRDGGSRHTCSRYSCVVVFLSDAHTAEQHEAAEITQRVIMRRKAIQFRVQACEHLGDVVSTRRPNNVSPNKET